MKKIFLFFSLALLFSSCKNLVPYTDSMRKQHNWTEEQVKRIQFYVSHDVVLHRELTKGSTEIIQGKIKMENGKKVEEILIRSGTPGVLTDMPKENKMLVSFELGDDHYLSFGVNPDAGDKYVLLASDWKNGMGKIHYAGNEYYSEQDSKYACLLVDLRRIDKMAVNERVAKGRKVQ